MQRLLTLFVLLLLTCSLPAQTSAEYDEVMNKAFPADGPGATVLIAKKGAIVYHKGFGKADLEHDIAMRTDHIFRIGSITKQFTASAILKLAEEGKLSLDDEITKFLPDYPTQEHKITITHLLNHTSGIKSYTGLEKWTPEVHKQDFTPQEMVDFFKDEPMDFAPGEEFRYNNSGYFLLGYIIEKASGMDYGSYIEKTFFEPLGMKHSSYDRTTDIIPNRASGYGAGPNGYANAPYLSMTQPYGAGSLLSTVADLNIWYQAVVAGKVISQENFKKATTPAVLNNGEKTDYGFGWSMGETEGSPHFGHGGGIHGFLTASDYFLEEEVFVTVFSNCNCNPPGGVAKQLGTMAIGKYEPIEVVELPEAMLDKYAGKYELMPGFFETITKDGKQLMGQATGQGTMKLTAFKEHQFINETAGIKIRFNMNDQGEVPTFTLFQGGEREAKRVE
jgi:CubicO group peptidase (beta-lactamase class C family)